MTARDGTSGRARVESIDVLRGAIMVLMALDHVRDFFGQPGVNPTDLARTTAPLFFTRWVTYFCAPVFFLLTGTGACLARRRKSAAELSWFLFTRGLWLIVLDEVVVRCFGLQFNVDYRVTLLLVLWALGWSMIALAALSRLPLWAVTGVGLAMVVAHNLFDGLRPQAFGILAPVWSILHVQGFVVSTPRVTVLVAYPLIPWIGVTAAGFGLGQVFSWSAERRRRFLIGCGIVLTTAFFALRAVNGYGDPSRWSMRASGLATWMSFLNATKYPPSLLFLLMTMGPSLLFLAAIDRRTPALLRPALVFGRVPLFYYVVHLPLIHLLAVGVCLVRYGDVHWMFESPRVDLYPFTPPPGWGYGLPIVYLIWIAVVAAMYLPSRWFGEIKQRGRAVWLSYF